eukprot:10003-Heterococcus_DN1.PRE.1
MPSTAHQSGAFKYWSEQTRSSSKSSSSSSTRRVTRSTITRVTVPRPLSTVGSAVLVQDNAFAALQKHHIHELLNSVTRSPDGRVAVNRSAVDRVWLVRNTRLWKLYTLHRDHVATVAHTSQLHDAGGRKPSIATAQNTWVQNTLNLRTDVNEHLLFHGCRSVNRAKIIIEQGGGIYFADTPDVSRPFAPCVQGGFDGTGSATTCILIVARVLLGQPHFTNNNCNNLRRPPCCHGHVSDECGHTLCDSVVKETATRQMCIYDKYR